MPRTFGVEIECLVPRDWATNNLPALSLYKEQGAYSFSLEEKLARRHGWVDHGELRRLFERKYGANSWRERDFGPTDSFQGWSVVKDSSIKEERGFLAAEFVSPVLSGRKGMAEAVRVHSLLRKAGAKANRSCGLHVHMGVAGLWRRPLGAWTSDELEAWLASFIGRVAGMEEELWASTTPWRRRSSFCRSIRGETPLEVVEKAKDEETDRLLNVAPVLLWQRGYLSKPTVEFRHLAGTMDRREFLHGIRVVMDVARRAAEVKP